MQVELGRHTWNIDALQLDKERRKFWTSKDERLDYIEYTAVLYFNCPAAAKHCFKKYEYNEDTRLDIIDEDRHTGEKHLENRMKVKRQEGPTVVLEKQKAMGKLAPKVLNDSGVNE